jgi:hypothetical protein
LSGFERPGGVKIESDLIPAVVALVDEGRAVVAPLRSIVRGSRGGGHAARPACVSFPNFGEREIGK